MHAISAVKYHILKYSVDVEPNYVYGHMLDYRKKCVVIELTVLAEENFPQANSRKNADLIQECQEAGWEVKNFPVEDGSRGFTNQTLRSCFKYLDLSNKDIRKAIDDISKTALRATYTIWLARSNKIFGSWELVERPVVPIATQLERGVPGAKALNPD